MANCAGFRNAVAELERVEMLRPTPQPVINTLNSALVATMKDPDMRERLIKQGAEPLGGSPEELRQYLAGEISKWGKVIREAGIKAD